MGLMLGLARKMKEGMSSGLKANMVEGLPYYINDISYWVPDVMKTRQMVAEMQGVPFDDNIKATAQRAADEYRQNLPANAHLDDGTYYQGMDNVKPKTPVKPPVKPVAPTPVKPPGNPAVKNPTATPPASPSPPPVTTPPAVPPGKPSTKQGATTGFAPVLAGRYYGA